MTEALAARAWSDFNEIEREGGIVESLCACAFQRRIASARAALLKNVASGGAPLVGATIHLPAEAEPAPPAIESHAALVGLEPIRLEDAAVKAAA